jgi:hypothetical protein
MALTNSRIFRSVLSVHNFSMLILKSHVVAFISKFTETLMTIIYHQIKFIIFCYKYLCLGYVLAYIFMLLKPQIWFTIT